MKNSLQLIKQNGYVSFEDFRAHLVGEEKSIFDKLMKTKNDNKLVQWLNEN